MRYLGQSLFFILAILFSFVGCNKNDSTSPQDDFLLSGIWYNSTTSEAIRITNDKNIYRLQINSEGCIAQDGSELIMKVVQIENGNITICDLESNNDTLNGTFNINENNLNITIISRNGVTLIPSKINLYEKRTFGELVLLKTYFSASVSNTEFNASSVSLSFSSGNLIVSGNDSFNGGMSIRANITGNGDYILSTINKGAFSFNGTNYQTTQSYTGQLKINIYDLEKHYIAGTFNFDAVSGTGDVVQIRSGKFGKKY